MEKMWRRETLVGAIALIILMLLVSPVLAQEPAPPIISGESTDAFECDDTAETATPVDQIPFEQMHNFGVQGDQDWLRFKAVTGGRYTFRARPYLPEVGMEIRMDVFRWTNNGLEKVASSDLVGDESMVTFVAIHAEEYFVRVTETDGRGGADYAYVVSGSRTDLGKIWHMIPLPTF